MLYLDNDLQHKLSLQPGVAPLVVEQIIKDSEFLTGTRNGRFVILFILFFLGIYIPTLNTLVNIPSFFFFCVANAAHHKMDYSLLIGVKKERFEVLLPGSVFDQVKQLNLY